MDIMQKMMEGISESRNTTYGINEGKQFILGWGADEKPILSGKTGNVTQHMKLAATNGCYELAAKWSRGLASSHSKEEFANFIRRVAMDKDAEKYFEELKKFQGSSTPYGIDKSGKKILVNIGFDGSKYKGKKPVTAQYDIMPMFDSKYKIAQEQISKAKEVHTSNDRIAHDAVIGSLSKGTKIVFWYQNSKNGHASDLRLDRAASKLSASGFEVEMR